MKQGSPETDLAREIPRGWTPLPVEHLPEPTFWPAGLGLGITFLFWGLISSWIVLAAGAIVFVGSLVGWIVDMNHEGRDLHS